MLSRIAVPGTTFMRTTAALAVLLLAACMAPNRDAVQSPAPLGGEPKIEASPAVQAPLAGSVGAVAAAGSPDLQWLVQRPLPWDPMPRWIAAARAEVRRYRAQQAIVYRSPAGLLTSSRPASGVGLQAFGRVAAVLGSRVAIQFDSAAAARSMSEIGNLYDSDGYKGEVQIVERHGPVWVGRVVFLRPEVCFRTGDFVASRHDLELR